MRNIKLSLLSLIVLALMLMGVSMAGATSITPIVYTNNPDFEDLGYAYGYKIDTPVSGGTDVTVDAGPGEITVHFDYAGAGMVGFSSIDWSSTFGIDAVIVVEHIGDPGYANVFFYRPPGSSSFGDDDLVRTGPGAIIGVEFCWDEPTQTPEPATLLLLGLGLVSLSRVRRKS